MEVVIQPITAQTVETLTGSDRCAAMLRAFQRSENNRIIWCIQRLSSVLIKVHLQDAAPTQHLDAVKCSGRMYRQGYVRTIEKLVFLPCSNKLQFYLSDGTQFSRTIN